MANQSAIERLIAAHANGWHLLSMSRATANAILDNCDLSRTQKVIVRDIILPRITSISSQSRSLNFGVICVPPGLHITPNPKRVPLPISFFENPDSSLPAYVIVESIEGDGAFIEFLCEIFGRKLGFMSGASLTFLAGGGDTTANRYRDIAERGRAVLCVVDSDRLYPDGGLGNTARAVVAIDTVQPLAKSYVLPVREMENLVPHDMLALVYDSNATIKRQIRSINDYVTNHAQPDLCSKVIYGHHDIKEGVNKKFLRRQNVNSQTIWHGLIAHMGLQRPDYDNDNEDEDKMSIIPAISARALQTTIEFFRRKPHHISAFVKSSQAHIFGFIIENLVSDVLSITAAPDRIRSSL